MIRDIEKIYNLHSPKVIEVLNKIPREEFVPEKDKHLAYEDTAISIGEGQTISQPYTVAFMTHLLDLKGNEKVLEIGTGSGYQAAVLSFLAKEVFTIERIKSLAKKASKTFKKLGFKNIYTKVGQGEEGWEEKSPFDAIIITANTKKVPKTLFDQLKVGGRLVVPMGKDSKGEMTKYIKTKKKITKKEYGIYYFVPLITS
ncbi:protein-L-isoaspartate(D-aspartate) O-methyltransferase [Patescibacteria group bacterium]|nr:protein-L-isoaspartate(D-aspartate) O-methyltransferase [Patescibacteria group bacterium]MBU2036107.1 protein-L-isoaspartate(D-aspartate) O-methyltransferase [Patescibacteria group bacterium]